MVGFNLPSPDAANPDEGYDQLQIVWISDKEILFRNPPTEDIP
ncbi:MAG TPA: hypothetical protein VFR94_04295 [Nitrososphaeraceae archaeon]|nr:hypothetical protein [Nitrososphaeraceae archaeon]